MILWTNFDNRLRNDISGEVRLQLYEHWLSWVGSGPSTTAVFAESPMLELAHERQFVVSQQGWDNADFEDQHSRRIEDCLRQLDSYFNTFATNEPCRPGSPYAADLVHCWNPNTLSHTIPPLHLSADEVQGGEVTISNSSSRSTPSAISPAKHASLDLSSMAADSDSEDDDDSDDMSNSWQQTVLGRSRTATNLPIHGSRASKFVRQGTRYESKLTNNLLPASKKRGSQWVTDKVGDEAIIAERSQSIAALRPNHERVVRDDGT